MAIYVIINPDYNKISLISDDAISQNQLDVYFNNTKIGFFAASGHPTPNGSYAKVLNFGSTVTSLGTKYLFEFTPENIAQAVTFTDGVYHFILNTTGANPLPLIGLVSDKNIMCCIGQYLKDKDTLCSDEYNGKVMKSYSFLVAAKAAIRFKDVQTAMCNFNNAACLNCESCE